MPLPTNQGPSGYRLGMLFFGAALAVGLAALPFGVRCCSRFSAQEEAWRSSTGVHGWEAGITPAAVALLDWPIGFRLLLLATVSAAVCLAATIAAWLLARRRANEEGILWRTIARAVLASLTTGVLYLCAIFAAGYTGYVGPANGLWMLGIPLVVAQIGWPRLAGVALALPLAFGGWLCLGAISIGVGIPLD